MVELDATAGYRLMDRYNPPRPNEVIYLDKRIEVKPDILADARFLPIRDHSVRKIRVDPPHWFRVGHHGRIIRLLAQMPDDLAGINGLRHSENDVPYQVCILKKYGYWQTKTQWISFAYHTNQEFARVLEHDGIVWYKLCIMPSHSPHITIASIREHYQNFKIIEKTEYPSRSHMSKSVTVFLTMKSNGNGAGELSNYDTKVSV
jgi:hypothetical protein